jgi:hypothetical protein
MAIAADETTESRLGRAEAEAFDAKLREVEDRQRRERSERLAAGDDEGSWSGPGWDAAPTEVARLRSQVEALASFQAAVLRSKPWRVIQSVRRLFGRAW